ncbi:uncharacterized protein ARMOST_03973 [Armillaria ostoyae]|uniref:DUF6532 domain-containing protein n=1 Tax=Armillaria ostoyae TaxID=47428 RepID=A0A284QW10_ARMOS|nr:uncharacterized protein ARMOST_03973 [Armillaria ostoyae]
MGTAKGPSSGKAGSQGASKRAPKPSKKQSAIDQDAADTENRKLQALIANLQKENVQLKQKQVLSDSTNRRLRADYANEYSQAHNGHQLSDVESEDEEIPSVSLNFSSSIQSRGTLSSPPPRLRKKGTARLMVSSPPSESPLENPIPHIDFRSGFRQPMANRSSIPWPSSLSSDAEDPPHKPGTESSPSSPSSQEHQGSADDESVAELTGTKRPPSPSALEPFSKTKKARVAEVASGAKGLNQRDYKGTVREILNNICKGWEQQIYTINAYPDTVLQREWIQELWEEQCEKVGETYELTMSMKTMIKKRSPHIRGALKAHIKPLVAAMYGFVASASKGTIKQNKSKYVMLAMGGAFTCKDPQAMCRRFENKIIPMIITEYFFGHRKAPGIIWEDDFDPIKPETLALIITLVEHCINEWADGTFKVQELHETTQSARYVNHLKNIKAWCKEDQKVTANICRVWTTKGRTHAEIQPKQAANGYVNDAERVQLRVDLQGRTGETDSEAEDETEGGDKDTGLEQAQEQADAN